MRRVPLVYGDACCDGCFLFSFYLSSSALFREAPVIESKRPRATLCAASSIEAVSDT